MEKVRILKACRHLFGKWGIHRVTMDDVSKHLGISKKTLYKIYINKDAIVTDFVRKLIEESRLELKNQIIRGQTLTIRLTNLIGLLLTKHWL